MPTVDQYIIQRSPTGVSDWVNVGTVSGATTTFTDTGLTASTTYYYRVFAQNDEGTSAASNVANATTASPVTSPPFYIDALMWLDPTDETTMWQDATKTTPVTTIGDPVLYWEDKTGNGNDWTGANIGDSPTWEGTHLQFTSAYMSGPDFSSLTGGTLTMRVETPGPITSQIIGWSHFLGPYNTSGSQATWVTSTTGTYGDHRWGFLSGVRRTAGAWSSFSQSATDDMVHTETHDGTDGKCYLDNDLIDTQTFAVDAPSTTLLGAVRNPSGQMTNGKMYGCVLYDRALSAGEISDVVDYFNGA